MNSDQISQIRGAVARLATSTLIRQNTGLTITGSLLITLVDEGIIYEMERMGFPRMLVLKSLQHEDYNHSSTTYFLLLTRKSPTVFSLDF